MKKIVLSIVFFIGSMAVQAQELTWETNFDKAAEISMKTKKPILLFLQEVTGADGVFVHKKKF